MFLGECCCCCRCHRCCSTPAIWGTPPETVLPVTIADGWQHVFPKRGCLSCCCFCCCIVKLTIHSMPHYTLPTKLCWRQVVVLNCSRSSGQYRGNFEGRLGGGLFDSLLHSPVVISFILEMILRLTCSQDSGCRRSTVLLQLIISMVMFGVGWNQLAAMWYSLVLLSDFIPIIWGEQASLVVDALILHSCCYWQWFDCWFQFPRQPTTRLWKIRCTFLPFKVHLL